MRLLENVRGAETADDVILTAMATGKRLGKVSVLVGVYDGFVGNRILHQYLRWASILLEDGCMPEQIDRVWTEFGMPMGPFAMSDLAGLDVGYRIRQEQAATRSGNERYVEIGDRVVEMGRLGQKTGGGYFDYIEGSRKPVPNAEVTALVLSESARKGIERRQRRRDPPRPDRPDDQRGGQNPRRGPRHAAGRHRYHLHFRLRLPGLPGWAYVPR